MWAKSVKVDLIAVSAAAMVVATWLASNVESGASPWIPSMRSRISRKYLRCHYWIAGWVSPG